MLIFSRVTRLAYFGESSVNVLPHRNILLRTRQSLYETLPTPSSAPRVDELQRPAITKHHRMRAGILPGCERLKK